MSTSIAVARKQLNRYKRQMLGKLIYGRLLGIHRFDFSIFHIDIYANHALGVVRYSFKLNRLGKQIVSVYGVASAIAIARFCGLGSSISRAIKKIV